MSTAMNLHPQQGWIRLTAIMAITAVIWFVVLPWLSLYPPMAARLQWLDDQKVDPSAMYYTEVEALKPVLQRLNERGRLSIPDAQSDDEGGRLAARTDLPIDRDCIHSTDRSRGKSF